MYQLLLCRLRLLKLEPIGFCCGARNFFFGPHGGKHPSRLWVEWLVDPVSISQVSIFDSGDYRYCKHLRGNL